MHKITREQKEIYDYQSFDMVITAPAGCGKTEALAYRAKGLIERANFTRNGRRLLVLTFTNQARDNISERLRKHIRFSALKNHVTVCNFHGLAARIISAYGNTIGIDRDWTIANFNWLDRKIRSLGCDSNTKEQVRSILQKTKLNYLEDAEVMNALSQIQGKAGTMAISLEKERITERILTYDDQVRVALWILQDKKVSRQYENHFFAAIVDEFQDLTPQQLRFVRTICGNNITYAGDLSQSIFSFAGADPVSTFSVLTEKDVKQIKLFKSFRSAPAILNTINALSPITKSEHLEAAFPEHWGNGGLSSFVSFSNRDSEAQWIVKKCKSIMINCPEQRIGIISRTGFRQSTIKKALRHQGVPFVDWGDGLFKPKIAQILRCVCDDIPDGLTDRTLDLLLFIREEAISLQGTDSEELEDSCGWLFDQLLWSTPLDVKKRIISQSGNENIATKTGIHCLTGHAGKGQQFDWVFIAGLEDGMTPFYKAKTKEEVLEEARILSVMISRARIGIVSTLSTVDSYGRKVKPSCFLKKIKEVDCFLAGEEQIEAWFAEAEWHRIKKM